MRVSARSLLMSRYFNGLAIRYMTMPNRRLLQIKKLKSLVQRAKENLEENIIDLYKEITRLEKIENDAKILR